jgi:hypothetical protein
MTDDADKLPSDSVGDLDPVEVADDAAAAIRGGAGVSIVDTIERAVNDAMQALGNALNQTARKG